MKHVFIDTNIFLKIYSFTDDHPNFLKDLIEKIENGDIKLYLTQQVIDEFYRNREVKLHDSLKTVKELKDASFKTPSFCKEIPSIKKIQKKFLEINKSAGIAYKKLLKDSIDEKLELDKLFRKLCKKVDIIQVTTEIINEAKERFAKGNPPGKNKSHGDAINWIILLEEVPNGEILFLITGDGDFLSKIDDYFVSPFLKNEWKNLKKTEIQVYKSLSRFLKDEFSVRKITKKQIDYEEKKTPKNYYISDFKAPMDTRTESLFTYATPSPFGVRLTSRGPLLETEVRCSRCNKVFYTEGSTLFKICPYCDFSNI